MDAGICNFCGRHAHKGKSWSHIQIGVTRLQVHEECAARYYAQGLHPGSIGERLSRARDDYERPLRLRFGPRAPRYNEELRFA